MNRSWILALGVMTMVFSGCSYRLADFTIASIKNSNVPAKTIGKTVTGENCVFSWLGIQWLGKEPNIKEAVDQAMQSAGPEYDALVNMVIYKKTDLLKNCYTVKGTAVSTKK
jgi:hypothetical protein